MIKVLFVCHGNICRSPMAECFFRDLIEKRGLAYRLYTESRALFSDELGSPPHPGTVRKLKEHGISCAGKRAELFKKEDYAAYDYIVGMDNANFARLRRLTGDDPAKKVYRLLDFTARPGEVADPWYTGDFETTWNDIKEGCEKLLEFILHNN